MKAAMTLMVLFVGTAAFFLVANGIESEGLTITGSARPIEGPLNVDAQSTEDKIAQLQSGLASDGEQANEKHGTFFSIGLDPAQSNRTIQQLSKLINLSSNNTTNSTAKNVSIINSKTLNWTALNTTAPGAKAINASDGNSDGKNSVTSYVTGMGSVSGSTAVGPEGVSSSSQSSVKGSHNYSSTQGGLGKSKIKSSMSLEGDFEVQRSSSY